MKEPASIGDRELALLRHIASRGGATVGEAFDEFGSPRGLARSTILTMMERLRRKGRLTRRAVGGVYRYSSPASPVELLRASVRSFVERRLGGSSAPLVAYLTERGSVSDEELAELERLVNAMQRRRRKEPGP